MKTLSRMFVSSLFALATLGIAKVASAQDCKPPMVFVSGVQEYQGASTSDSTYIIRGNSAVVRVRLACADNKTSGVSNDGGLPQTKNVQQAEWAKSGNTSVKMASAFIEFEGPLSVTEPGKKVITFTVSPTESYTITFDFRKSFAESGDSYTKPESDARYPKKEDVHTKDEANGRFSPIGSSYTKDEADGRFCKTDGTCANPFGEGRLHFLGGPMGFFRPYFTQAGGAFLSASYRFAPHDKSAFELTLVGSSVFGGGKVKVRGVEGVPTTSEFADQYIWTIGLLAGGDIYLSDRVSMPLAGGLGYQYLRTSEQTIGNDPATQRQWFNPAMSDHTLLLMANWGFRFQLTESASPGASLMIGAMPSIQAIPTRKMSGGDNTVNQFQVPVYATFGLQL